MGLSGGRCRDAGSVRRDQTLRRKWEEQQREQESREDPTTAFVPPENSGINNAHLGHLGQALVVYLVQPASSLHPGPRAGIPRAA